MPHRRALLEKAYRAAVPGTKPAFIEFVQTFGDLVNFHPHVHVLAADGVFRADGTFAPLPAIPEALLERAFRRAVLDFLVREGAISDELRERMLGWRYSGFSVHNQVRVAADEENAKSSPRFRRGIGDGMYGRGRQTQHGGNPVTWSDVRPTERP